MLKKYLLVIPILFTSLKVFAASGQPAFIVDGSTMIGISTLANIPSSPVTTAFVHGSTLTIGGSTRTINSFSLAVASDTVWLESYIWANCVICTTNDNKTGYYVLRATARNTDGTVVEPNPEVLSPTWEVAAACNVTATVVGNNFQINVVGTGISNEQVYWHSFTIYHHMRN